MTSEHPSPAELNDSLSGKFDRIQMARIRSHCKTCPDCERRFGQIAALRLLSREPLATHSLAYQECLSDSTLKQYLYQQDEFSVTEIATIEEHLRACDTCRVIVEMICHESELPDAIPRPVMSNNSAMLRVAVPS